MTIGHINGFHASHIRFCSCQGSPDKIKQLMDAQLFPGSIEEPRTAFSFQLLKTFHLLHLEGKVAAYDFVGALRHLTDNAFMADTPVRIFLSLQSSEDNRFFKNPYARFLLVMRIWRYLALRRRTGQTHGIDSYFPHRVPGSLIIHCPACPQIDLNSDGQWKNIPDHLRFDYSTYYQTCGWTYSDISIKVRECWTEIFSLVNR
jgi:hypothetical protein